LLCFLVEILSVRQVVDHHLVLVVFVFQFQHVVGSLILIMLGLFQDVDGVHALPHISFADLLTMLFDLVIDLV